MIVVRKVSLFGVLCFLSTLPSSHQAKPKPVVFDTDYGPFIDDIFALGLLVNPGDLLDLKYVLTTSEDPPLSAKCVAKHLDLAGRSDIPVGVGSAFPAYEERGSVCGIPGLVGFALQAECENVTLPFVDDGLADMATMIMESDRDDWWYIVVGGQTSLKVLLQDYPDAAAKIETLIVMAGNWCAGFDPYPDVTAPTDETNIGCDPAAANFVLDGTNNPIPNIYYVPVVMADEIGGSDYIKIVDAANTGADAGAAATIDFYRTWSAAGRADENLLIHLEAMTYDPETESTPMFDPCAIMLALELLNGCEQRSEVFEFDAVHFLEAGEGVAFPESPRSAFSLHTGAGVEEDGLPEQCPTLTEYTFDAAETPEEEVTVMVALGYKSAAAKDSFYAEMAERMAGIIPSVCTTGPTAAPTTGEPGSSGNRVGLLGSWIAAVGIATLVAMGPS